MSMNDIAFLIALIVIIIFSGFFWRLSSIIVAVIFEHERGVVYRQGKFNRVLQPGSHFLYPYYETLQKVDIRARFITIPGQDVLSSDNISVKVSLAVNFKVDDPFKAMNTTFNYSESL